MTDTHTCESCGKALVEVDNPIRREVRHRRGEEVQCPAWREAAGLPPATGRERDFSASNEEPKPEGNIDDCPVAGCGDERPHYHREDADWGDYKVYYGGSIDDG